MLIFLEIGDHISFILHVCFVVSLSCLYMRVIGISRSLSLCHGVTAHSDLFLCFSPLITFACVTVGVVTDNQPKWSPLKHASCLSISFIPSPKILAASQNSEDGNITKNGQATKY